MKKLNWRKIHRFIAPILFLPILLTTVTGVAYRLGRSWFKIPKGEGSLAETLLSIHQGGFLGEQLRPYYVLLDGLGLVGLLVTGMFMMGLFGKRPRRQADI
jgi:hypothetical protein